MLSDTMKAIIEERVARGAALLDEKVPGWREQVDVASLRMESCARCILGQIYNDYYRGMQEIEPGPWTPEKLGSAVRNGFTLSAGEGQWKDADEDWDYLGDCWVKEIQR